MADRETAPEQDDSWYDCDDDLDCGTCGGRGIIVTCIDDLCHTSDGCIHGDGEEICPTCKGRYL